MAQSTGEERSRDVEERVEQERQVQSSTGRRTFDIDALGDAEPVTYAEVLADPDNIDLNFRYALTQVRNGNVRGAGATLERILLLRPDLAVVRVLYAIVLFRLDNLDEAERELLAVRDLEMSDDLRNQIDRYLDEIEQRRQRTRFTLLVSLARQFDWNRNAAPNSERRLVTDLPTVTTGEDSRHTDWGNNGFTQLSFEHDLGLQSRHMMIGDLVYYESDQTTLDDLDLQAITGTFGYRLDFTPDTITPTVTYEHIRLSREKYMQSLGASVDWRHELTSTWYVSGGVKVKYQAFNGITGNTAATERSGRYVGLTGGTSYALSPTQRIALFAEHARNGAARSYNAYVRNEIGVSHTQLFEGGDFLLSSATLAQDRYDDRDPAISARTRRDVTGRLRLTYGIPWGTLFPDSPEGWKDFTLTASAEAFRQVSTITNYTYNNYRFSLGISRRWEF